MHLRLYRITESDVRVFETAFHKLKWSEVYIELQKVDGEFKYYLTEHENGTTTI
jgi:hypothetical protein